MGYCLVNNNFMGRIFLISYTCKYVLLDICFCQTKNKKETKVCQNKCTVKSFVGERVFNSPLRYKVINPLYHTAYLQRIMSLWSSPCLKINKIKTLSSGAKTKLRDQSSWLISRNKWFLHGPEKLLKGDFYPKTKNLDKNDILNKSWNLAAITQVFIFTILQK